MKKYLNVGGVVLDKKRNTVIWEVRSIKDISV